MYTFLSFFVDFQCFTLKMSKNGYTCGTGGKYERGKMPRNEEKADVNSKGGMKDYIAS